MRTNQRPSPSHRPAVFFSCVVCLLAVCHTLLVSHAVLAVPVSIPSVNLDPQMPMIPVDLLEVGEEKPPETLPHSVAMPDLADWDRRHLAIPKELLATQAGSLFIWPALGRVSSPFGPRFYGKRGIRVHEGLDIPLPYGSAIHAARAGVVKKADSSLSGYGRMVEIDHGGGIVTRYAHCSSFAVTKGQRVDAGQVIAYAGSSGRSSNAHLHFEIRLDGVAYNPMVFLQSAPTGDRMVRK